ncbi:hypothetical protein [Rahnella sp. ChDrAdgB13]|uniref:hypothetical protein n=1 Tax=Rahnella sp. ChDrAdgB13 TaxID=1850581 RepID=UPI001AD88D71|nr:hypothetical protein [Rahnella sp. ChDrAdgB13]
MSKKVVVCSMHPVIGRVFWKYTYEGDVNMPDYFGLTTDISSAVVLEPDWRQPPLRVTEDFIYHIDFDNGSFKRGVLGNSGISTEEFISWAYSTKWENLCVDAIAGDAGIVYD